MSTHQRWTAGEHITLRFVGHDDGLAMGYPQVVVADTDDELILFQPAGTIVENRRYTDRNNRADAFGGAYRPLPPTFVPALDTLRIIPAGAGHAIELLYALDGQPNPPYLGWAEPDAALRGAKINLQTLLRRTAIGVDTTDNRLDLTMRADLQWNWKDAEQVRDCVKVGLTYAEEAVAFYAEAERVIAQIEAGCGHFAGGFARWTDWRPDPAWSAPALPADWHEEPGIDHDLNRRVPLPSA